MTAAYTPILPAGRIIVLYCHEAFKIFFHLEEEFCQNVCSDFFWELLRSPQFHL